MSYGDHPVNAPDKPGRGLENGACDAARCQAEPASWLDHLTGKYYCGECAHTLGNAPSVYNEWMKKHWPQLGHPQFELRQDFENRKVKSPTRSFGDRIQFIDKPSRFIRRYGRHRANRF